MSYEDDEEETSFEFELLNSDCLTIATLVCKADKEITPDVYASALREYADRIESILSMAECSDNLLN